MGFELENVGEIDLSRSTPGALDGVVIARFANAFRDESGGGVERYLYDLNSSLMDRNRIVILQAYLTEEPEREAVETLCRGKGKLVMIPVPYRRETPESGSWRGDRRDGYWVCYRQFLSTLDAYDIDLAVFHWISRTSGEVARYFAKRKVPFVLVNHFHNKRFWRWLRRKEFICARAVGGVSAVDLPWFMRGRFANLSDGIDKEFFRIPERGETIQKVSGGLILLVSRVIEGKGHLEAVQALKILGQWGLKPTLAFIGRVDSQLLMDRLQEEVARNNLANRVVFTGQLAAEQLRTWYAGSDVTILPSRVEGLGRVLLEAQAMKIPVVAYSVGGVREALKDGETGFLVPAGDIQELAGKLRLLLENQELRSAMGEQGRIFVEERFSLSELALRHERFYLSALGGNQTILNGEFPRTRSSLAE